ncbi:Hsp20/alpha crystallin family protein [Ferruginibacter lapsinanis]|uniref:Hsp20/alpha crystallin family protein n=1 Tax=Ferruginibacter lapsinanis TaxID=563172 RepID=UPI001E5827F9|nr:Hsp20/alpha crystallin family protein [Ferruginibacter lapsinanis]UEG50143.1 Hsp20/alpha crystallin family protein [Ferruginibacter lapsinanis]
MNNLALHLSTNSIYPGEFIPLFSEEEIRNELNRSVKEDIVYPPVNMLELRDSFEIEVALPGIKREELLINCDDNILSVCVIHKEQGSQRAGNFQLHEFNYECFDRHIILPENVDAEFVNAEYKEGILHLRLPKTDQPSKKPHTRIVVY